MKCEISQTQSFISLLLLKANYSSSFEVTVLEKTSCLSNQYGLDRNTATNYQLQHFKGIIDITKQIGRSLLGRKMGFFHSTTKKFPTLHYLQLHFGRKSFRNRKFCSIPSFLIIVLQWELFQQGNPWLAKPYQTNRPTAHLFLWLLFRQSCSYNSPDRESTNSSKKALSATPWVRRERAELAWCWCISTLCTFTEQATHLLSCSPENRNFKCRKLWHRAGSYQTKRPISLSSAKWMSCFCDWTLVVLRKPSLVWWPGFNNFFDVRVFNLYIKMIGSHVITRSIYTLMNLYVFHLQSMLSRC